MSTRKSTRKRPRAQPKSAEVVNSSEDESEPNPMKRRSPTKKAKTRVRDEEDEDLDFEEIEIQDGRPDVPTVSDKVSNEIQRVVKDHQDKLEAEIDAFVKKHDLRVTYEDLGLQAEYLDGAMLTIPRLWQIEGTSAEVRIRLSRLLLYRVAILFAKAKDLVATELQGAYDLTGLLEPILNGMPAMKTFVDYAYPKNVEFGAGSKPVDVDWPQTPVKKLKPVENADNDTPSKLIDPVAQLALSSATPSPTKTDARPNQTMLTREGRGEIAVVTPSPPRIDGVLCFRLKNGDYITEYAPVNIEDHLAGTQALRAHKFEDFDPSKNVTLCRNPALCSPTSFTYRSNSCITFRDGPEQGKVARFWIPGVVLVANISSGDWNRSLNLAICRRVGGRSLAVLGHAAGYTIFNINVYKEGATFSTRFQSSNARAATTMQAPTCGENKDIVWPADTLPWNNDIPVFDGTKAFAFHEFPRLPRVHSLAEGDFVGVICTVSFYDKDLGDRKSHSNKFISFNAQAVILLCKNNNSGLNSEKKIPYRTPFPVDPASLPPDVPVALDANGDTAITVDGDEDVF